MAITTTYPGGYIEKLPPQERPSAPLTTAAMGIVGYTEKGPTNDPAAGLVRSWADFVSKFGGLTTLSLVPLSVYTYFQEGGSAVYVCRVLGTGNAAAEANITEVVANELVAPATPPSGARGLVSATDHSATPSRVHSINLTRDPQLTGSTLSISYKAIGAVIAFEGTQVGDGATTAFTFTPGAAGYDAAGVYLEPGSVRIQVNAATTYYDKGDGTLITGAGATGTIIYSTGVVNITFGVAPTIAHTIKISYRKTADRTTKTVNISASDVFSGDRDAAGTNTINRTTGAVVFTTTSGVYAADGVAQANYLAVPDGYNATSTTRAVSKVEVDYTEFMWELNAIYSGAWGNDLRVRLQGDPDGLDSATQSFASYELFVQLVDDDGNYSTVETFSGLDVTTTTAARYLSTVVNDPNFGSKYIRIIAPFSGGAPLSLTGTAVTGETVVADGLGVVNNVTATLAYPPGEMSVVITFTDSTGDTVHTIADDGLGNLLGSDPSGETTLDSTVTASVNYTTGAIRFKTAVAVKNATAVTVAYYRKPSNTYIDYTLSSGSDGAALARSNISASALDVEGSETGIYTFKSILDAAIDLVQPPDFVSSTLVLTDCLTFAETRNNVFFIGTTPADYTWEQANDFRNLTIAVDNNKGALYYPWIQIKDPTSSLTTAMPPMAHVAAIYSKTDRTKNPGKNPAGTEDGLIRNSIGLVTKLTNTQRGVLDKSGVNCLMDQSYTGRVVYGANTLARSRTDAERFVNAARGNVAIAARIFATLWRYPFENNNENLRLKVASDIRSFLTQLFKAGWFKGATATEAFYVVCDDSNNSDVTVADGKLFVDIGIAWNKPALFVVLRLQQRAS